MEVRIRYAKVGKVRFLSHRDMARVVERAVRRAGLPVAYSQGFSPRAKLHFGLALSTGYESYAEYLDVDFDGAAEDLPEAEAVAGLLQPHVPPGIEVTASRTLEPGTPSLQDAVTSSTWEFSLLDSSIDELTACANRLLEADELPVELVRKGKQVREDLRPLLLSMDVERDHQGSRLIVELGTKPRSVRPSELLDVMSLDEQPAGVIRTHQWIQSDGERREPIELAAPSPHASVRAS